MTMPLTQVFLSTVLGKTVINGPGHEVGTLRDLIIVPGEHFPEVSHLLVAGHAKNVLVAVPWERVTLFNRFVITIVGTVHSYPSYPAAGAGHPPKA